MQPDRPQTGLGPPATRSRIRVQDYDIHLINLRTRLPFKYGIATMTLVPQIFVRLRIEIRGKTYVGTSADLLPPKWFTKDPSKPLEAEIMEMLQVIQAALNLACGLAGTSAFDLWQQLYEKQLRWGSEHHLAPLLTNFGCSLVERALIEAICRAKGQSFPNALRTDELSIRLEAIHPELLGISPVDFLPEGPLTEITVRHTIGLADPLTDLDISPAERLQDGLPQSLVASIQAYDLCHFKIKLAGNLDQDLDRLLRIAEILQRDAGSDYAFSLDGNEQFKAVEDFRKLWELISNHPKLGPFIRHLLFVEQPFHRDVALQPSIEGAFRDWPSRPPIIIDESDATMESLPVALGLGYAGTSHKNCKGVFKGIINCALLLHRKRAQPSFPFLMTGEDLCNIGPIALLQDLTVMACLGIRSVERNGHHYNAGLSQFPRGIQEQILSHHSDLYHRSEAGWPTLKIARGTIHLDSLLSAPFGVGFIADMEQFSTLDDWRLPKS